MEGRGDKPFSSVDNALYILLLFHTRRTLRVADVADELHVARSTAHRLLSAMVERGFAAQDPVTRAYLPGPVLVEIGIAAVSTLDIRDRARPIMNRLLGEVRETVSLVVLEGAQARFLDSVESPQTVRVGSRSGQLPAHCVSGGKALLTELSVEQVKKLYPGEKLIALTPASCDSRRLLLAQLEAMKERGYSTNLGESEADVVAVAVVLKMARVRAAVTVAAPTSRVSMTDGDKLGRRVQQIVSEIESALPRSPVTA